MNNATIVQEIMKDYHNQLYTGNLNLLESFHRIKRALHALDVPFASELTVYWARHTWATLAAGLDVPKETIAAALGHGANTVTDVYIDFDRRKVDAANRRVIDLVLHGE